jgi:hypothetical protein
MTTGRNPAFLPVPSASAFLCLTLDRLAYKPGLSMEKCGFSQSWMVGRDVEPKLDLLGGSHGSKLEQHDDAQQGCVESRPLPLPAFATATADKTEEEPLCSLFSPVHIRLPYLGQSAGNSGFDCGWPRCAVASWRVCV